MMNNDLETDLREIAWKSDSDVPFDAIREIQELQKNKDAALEHNIRLMNELIKKDIEIEQLKQDRTWLEGQLECVEAELKELEDEKDPTPWCHGCGAMTKKECHCGPIADND